MEYLIVKNVYGKFNYFIDLTKKCTIFIGDNGCGKSTILKIFHNIIQCGEIFDFYDCSQITVKKDGKIQTIDKIHNNKNVFLQFLKYNKNTKETKEFIQILKSNELLYKSFSRGYLDYSFIKKTINKIDFNDKLISPERFIKLYKKYSSDYQTWRSDDENSLKGRFLFNSSSRFFDNTDFKFVDKDELPRPERLENFIFSKKRQLSEDSIISKINFLGIIKFAFDDGINSYSLYKEYESYMNSKFDDPYEFVLEYNFLNKTFQNYIVNFHEYMFDSTFNRDYETFINQYEYTPKKQKMDYDEYERILSYIYLMIPDLSPMLADRTFVIEDQISAMDCLFKFYELNRDKPYFNIDKRYRKKFEQAENLLNKYFENKKIKFKGLKLEIIDEMGNEIDFLGLSAGETKIINLILCAIFSNDEYIIIDEPETSLNIVWQRDLLMDLLSVSSAKFIIATQSADIIRNPELDQYIVALPMENNYE